MKLSPGSHICRQELHRIKYQFRRNEHTVVAKGSTDEVGYEQGKAQSTFAAFSWPFNFSRKGKILNSWFKINCVRLPRIEKLAKNTFNVIFDTSLKFLTSKTMNKI